MTEAIDTDRRKTEGALRTSSNMFGYRGVMWRADRGNFYVSIGNHHKGTLRRSFGHATAIDAALAYDEMARELYGDIAHLNFPTEEEKKVRLSRLHEGLCPEGHDLKEFGYLSKRGRLKCRKCDFEIERKYKLRNPGHARVSHKKWRMANLEQARACCRKWRMANLEKARAAKREYMARKRAEKAKCP